MPSKKYNQQGSRATMPAEYFGKNSGHMSTHETFLAHSKCGDGYRAPECCSQYRQQHHSFNIILSSYLYRIINSNTSSCESAQSAADNYESLVARRSIVPQADPFLAHGPLPLLQVCMEGSHGTEQDNGIPRASQVTLRVQVFSDFFS